MTRGVAAAAFGLFVATLAWRFLAFTGFSNDHYGHLALAQQLLLGERPIRDFVDPGWPLTYLLSAAAWQVAGDTMAVDWGLTATAFALGAVCTVVVAHRLSGSLPIAILVTIVEILIFPRTYSYPKILAYAAGGWAMAVMAATPSLRRIALMALVTVVAFLLRHDHGLFIGLAGAVCVALASRTEGWRILIGRVGTLAAGVGLFLLPWILFVSLNGGLVAYFDTALEFSAAEANASNLRVRPRLTLTPGRPLLGLERPNRPLAQVEWTRDVTDTRRAALEQRYGLGYVRDSDGARLYYVHDTSEATLRALADDPHVAGTAGLGRVRRPAWREFLARVSPLRLAPALHNAANADAWMFWLLWCLPLICGALACRRAFHGSERWPGELAVIVALCLMAVLVNAGFLRDILRTRFQDAIVPAAFLGAWALGLCWTTRWRRRGLQMVTQAATVVVLTVTAAAVSEISELPERMANTGIEEGLEGVRRRATEVSALLHRPHRQDVAPPSRVSAALLPFFGYLDRCTSTADRLIVTAEFPDVLVLAKRGFASDGVVFGGAYSSARRHERTLERLRARPALFVLFMDRRELRKRFPLIESYVTTEYEPMTDVPVEGAETVPILVYRHRAPVRTDAITGWPCFQSG